MRREDQHARGRHVLAGQLREHLACGQHGQAQVEHRHIGPLRADAVERRRAVLADERQVEVLRGADRRRQALQIDRVSSASRTRTGKLGSNERFRIRLRPMATIWSWLARRLSFSSLMSCSTGSTATVSVTVARGQQSSVKRSSATWPEIAKRRSTG